MHTKIFCALVWINAALFCLKSYTFGAVLSTAIGECEKDGVLSWGGVPASQKETDDLHVIRAAVSSQAKDHRSTWLESVTDRELLRFLRHKHGNDKEAVKMILAHAKWRTSLYGPESEASRALYSNTPLHFEAFWLGYNLNNCPTLVIRTQVHDGMYYNEDPKIFSSFLVSVLEEGRVRFGVGLVRQMCVLMDRAGEIYRNGQKKIEKLDFGVLPRLVELFTHLTYTILDNYPELVESVKIAPASRFFSMCYKVTSRVMDAKSRAKFEMVKSADLRDKLHSFVAPAQLPAHLGGNDANEQYTSFVDIQFDPSSYSFPHNDKPIALDGLGSGADDQLSGTLLGRPEPESAGSEEEPSTGTTTWSAAAIDVANNATTANTKKKKKRRFLLW